MIIFCTNDNFNPFAPNAPFFYPLKTGGKKGCIGSQWVKVVVGTENYHAFIKFRQRVTNAMGTRKKSRPSSSSFSLDYQNTVPVKARVASY